MKFGQLLGAALFSSVASASLAAFAEGGNLPSDHILYGPKRDNDVIVAKRATSSDSSTTTATAADSTCTNGPNSRTCWSNGFSAATDFDAKWPTTGVTRYYTFTLSNTTCNPDGGHSRVCLLVNGQYPGPAVTANWGDYISVTVNNNLKNNGTSIHWHGIRQLGSNTMDGVNGITECPVAPGSSETYLFQATQFGTTWYHSHFSAQYGDGVVGPVVIYGPSSSNYDIDLGPLTVSDWYYQTAYQVDDLTLDDLQQENAGPAGSNILINGTNMNVAGTTGKYASIKLTAGKKHLIRLINISVDNAIRVSFDGHQMELVTSDFVPIKPLYVQSVLLAIGQRYEVIVTANQTAGNYWMRAEVEGNCLSANAGTGLAVVTYSTAKKATPTTSSTYTDGGNCDEPSPLVPWVPNQVGDQAQFIQQASELELSLVLPYVGSNQQSIVVWGINFTSIDVQWQKPVLSYVYEKNNSFPATENLIELATEGEWIFWIIQEVEPNVPIPHPIHLHGHDFYVLGKGVGTFNISSDPQNLQYTNPIRRDTSILPAGGWMVIAFPTDNPGAWLLHCHIAWHISEGLGVQFLESAATIPAETSAYSNQCNNWATYAPNAKYQKEGSGL